MAEFRIHGRIIMSHCTSERILMSRLETIDFARSVITKVNARRLQLADERVVW
jgi:hypothetical protein